MPSSGVAQERDGSNGLQQLDMVYATYVLANTVSNAYNALEILSCKQTEAKCQLDIV